MKPFKPNKQQLEAIANSCTKLWIPLTDEIYIPKECREIDKEFDCIRYTYAEDGHTSIRDIDEFVKEWSPLQPNEEYFIQEELACDKDNGDYLYGEFTKPVPYKFIQPTDQMTEQQSQFKFKVIGVEVKQCKELDDYWQELNPDGAGGMNDMWLNRQYPDTPYSSNPPGFLITIERIEQ